MSESKNRAALPAQAFAPAEEPVAVVDHVGSLYASGNAVVVVNHADAAKLTKGAKLYIHPAPVQDVAPSDALAITLQECRNEFGFLEGLVDQQTYEEISRKALSIAHRAAPQAGVQPPAAPQAVQEDKS